MRPVPGGFEAGDASHRYDPGSSYERSQQPSAKPRPGAGPGRARLLVAGQSGLVLVGVLPRVDRSHYPGRVRRTTSERGERRTDVVLVSH
jgi:hypothetical protein